MKLVLKKSHYVIFALLTFIVLFLILYLPVQPKGDVLDSGWTIQAGGKTFPVQLPYQQSIHNPETVVFSNTFTYTEGDVLIFTWLKGQAVEISINGQTVFQVGDPANPTANLWNNTFLVQLPREKQNENSIEIYLTSASFPINFSIPPYTLKLDEAQNRVAWINFIYNDFLLLSMGSALLIGFILIFLSIMQRRGWSAEIFFGAASILGAIESFDYQMRISTGSLDAYLLVKKILMICGYLAALSFVAGVEKYYRNNLMASKYLSIPTCISIFVIASQSNLIQFSNVLTFLNIILLIDLMIAGCFIMIGRPGKDWLIIPAIWLTLGLVQMIAVQVFHFIWPYVLQYILLLSTIMFGMNLLLEFNRVFSEKLVLEKKVDLDSLTTAYNRNILRKTSPDQNDVLILMDLDNFKSYNDRHGHQKGDRLLIQFAEIIKLNLRQQDLVVRYGGDEFLVLLHDVGIIDAEEIAKRIQSQYEDLTAEEHLSVSYGIERIEHSLDSDLNRADHLMYAMKHAKQLHSNINKNNKQEKS